MVCSFQCYCLLIDTGTFDVQALLINNNSSTGEVCFECVFLNGSTANGCLIEYECNTTTGYTNGDLTIYSKGGVTGICSCSHFTFSCLYSVSVYDIESDGTVDTSTPAYQTHTSIIGAPLICSPSTLTTTTTLCTPTITSTNLVIITASCTDHTEGTIH